jgi:hypothetical protein
MTCLLVDFRNYKKKCISKDQSKDDIEQRDAGAFRPDNRRWNYKQTY